MWRRWATLAVAAFLVGSATAMRLDPERIRARIRIEEEIEEERLAKVGRNRRQLATPKEISISVTAPLFSSRPFEFGPGSGDTEIPQSLDVGKKLSLKYPLVFYGKEYSNLYILSNGGIGFDATARSYRPNVLPGPTKLIAPFWNRNDLRNGGHVYYREVTSGRVLERGASEIRYQYDKQVKIKSAIVVTWEKMQPLGSAPLPDENTNTFQVALFVTENGTFANMIYNNIGWTQGAEAGFNPGEESLEYYSLPTSGTGNIMYLEENGNTGIPGEWMFELEEDRVTRCKAGFKGDTCDAGEENRTKEEVSECKKGEWGPDCVRCCRCSNDACHTATGECTQGGCRDCWGGQACQIKEETCSITQTVNCAHNAVSYADADRCGEPQQRCQCLNGFVGDGLKKCEDIDECAASPSPCHADAICTNTPGRFFCECRPGFTGDGVSDCHTDFLYPHAGNDALPTSKNSKVSYQLKTPMKIFGAMHEKVTVSTNGLIALGEPESAQLAGFRRLEEMPGVHGIAPFHAPIDFSQGGQVTVSEVSDPLVLQRATDTVRENYGDPTFKATNALIVTYMNVTNGKNAHGNTFQSLLIGGRDGHGQRLSFVEMLYQDLGWSDGAEAEIMADDVANSVALPGSGTEGVEQLSQLSNIHQPGVWLYRIDNKDVQPCVRSGLQPPYCDSAAPTLISESEPPTQPTSRGSALPEKNAIVPAETPPIGVTFGGPRAIQPEIAGEPAAAPSSRPRSTTSRPRPVFQSTPHSLDAGDIENMPPDVFEATFPPFITVVPELISSKKSQGLLAQPSTLAARPLPDFTKGTITPPSTVVHQKPASVEDDDSEVIEVNPIQQIVPELPRTAPTGAAVTSQNIQPLRTTGVATPVPRTTTEEPEEEEELSEGPITEGSKEPIFVFTTSKPILTTIRQFAVTKPRIVTASTSPADGPIRGPFEEQESEAASSKLAIIIPTAIVLVWLVVIGIVAIIACCRKKRSQRNFHSMYGGPVYPRSMAGAYALRRNSKGFEGSYEDHLEKAARLSSEMNAYNNQSSRVSLYGSYWNLAAANSSSPGSSGSPHRTSPFAPTYTSSNQRYSYTTGRY